MHKHPVFLFSVSVFLLLGVCDGRAFAQTIARPAVSVVPSAGIVYGAVVADVDGDGVPDLIGATSSMALAVALGRGDGSFAAPRLLGRNTVPIAVADFNGDTLQDLITAEMVVLPGRGDGTFGTARPIDTTVHIERDIVAFRAIARDFNGDGRRDLAIVDGPTVAVYPGNGDLTFGPRFTLPPAGDGAVAITSADFNADGRPDIAATTIGQSLELFRNDGAFLFSVSSIGQPTGSFGDQWGIASGDLNGDGARDVVVATSFRNGFEFGAGSFHLFLGRGDGTFQAPVSHDTGVNGAMTVAIGDFNSDGHPDIAIGNRSWRYADTPCTSRVYWDSITIAAGTGAGTFVTFATFRLDTRDFGSVYQNTHNALIAVDVNKDGRTDLVAVPGVSLLNDSAMANRAPQVSTGPDQTQEAGSEIRFEALATDADFDWLDFVWRDASGAIVRTVPNFCQQANPGDYTVTVSDRRGGTATDTFTVFPPNPDSAYLQIENVANVVGTRSPYTVRWTAPISPASRRSGCCRRRTMGGRSPRSPAARACR